MNIRSNLKTYEVTFIESLSEIEVLIEDSVSYFIIDKNVYDLYRSEFKNILHDRLYIVDAIEQNKTIEKALEICEQMTRLSSKRNTHLISIGGGIVQDISGFVANVLYRGIRWSFYPSTLLAACDSCIGGKTSLNYKGYKNLLGTFYPPDNIYIYINFFNTLSKRDFYSGLGEVFKFNIMSGKEGIENIEDNIDDILMRKKEIISQIVRTSLQFKKEYIEDDEFDKGRRVLLNYAHTFGHAFEISSDYIIPHGTAVVLGMIVANRISASRGYLKNDFICKVEKLCKHIIAIKLNSEWFEINKILPAIKKDKKQTDDKIKAVLMKEDLSLEVFDMVSEGEIEFALRNLRENIR